MLSSMWLLALTVGLLIVASAFFSGRTALTAASDARMRQLANKGNKRAKIVEKPGLTGRAYWIYPDGNNAVNVLGSAIATSFAIALFGEGGLVWATIGMTVLLVVFAEVMPKPMLLPMLTAMPCGSPLVATSGGRPQSIIGGDQVTGHTNYPA